MDFALEKVLSRGKFPGKTGPLWPLSPNRKKSREVGSPGPDSAPWHFEGVAPTFHWLLSMCWTSLIFTLLYARMGQVITNDSRHQLLETTFMRKTRCLRTITSKMAQNALFASPSLADLRRAKAMDGASQANVQITPFTNAERHALRSAKAKKPLRH